jgi:hypothetical protein
LAADGELAAIAAVRHPNPNPSSNPNWIAAVRAARALESSTSGEAQGGGGGLRDERRLLVPNWRFRVI